MRRLSSFPSILLASLLKIKWAQHCYFTRSSICLFLCQQQAVFIGIVVEINLRSGTVMTPALSLLLRIEVPWEFLYCFLWSCEIWHRKSDRYCIILWIDCGNKVTFMVLILSTQEHKLIFHRLVSVVIPFSHILMSFVAEVFYYFSTGDTV